ncbi:MAG: hypothetical protein DPW20_14325 [Candidatus Brocadia sp.]|nr:hypothetical protein [Candidatus Brocadia sp.]
MIPIEKVIKGCCKYYGKKEEELLRKGKGKRERQAAIYVSKIMSNAKNTEIGRYFETRIKREGKFRKEIEVLKKTIRY